MQRNQIGRIRRTTTVRYRMLVLLCTLILTGCANPWAKNNSNLLKLDMGMSREQVFSVMGEPQFNEAYQSLNGKRVTILFYWTELPYRTKDRATPVVLEEGKLVGWGSGFYQQKRVIDLNIKQDIKQDININKQ